MGVPTKKAEMFSTAEDRQDTVTIAVYEGERAMVKDNHQLGKFDLTGIPPAARGVPQIEGAFEIDVNGMLRVSAEDKGTGNKEKITIKNDNNRLSKEEIERMVRNAEKFAEEDQKMREKIEARNDLEGFAYTLKNQVNDKEKLGKKLDETQKEQCEDAIKDVINWLSLNPDAEKEECEKQKKKLEDITNPIITKAYEAKDEKKKKNSDKGGKDKGQKKEEEKEEEEEDEVKDEL